MEIIDTEEITSADCPISNGNCERCNYCYSIANGYAECSYEDEINYLEEKIIDDGEYKRKGYKDIY